MAAEREIIETFLAEIDAWSVRADSSPGELGQMTLNHGGFVPLLRKRGLLKPETAEHVRAFMRRFPDRETLTSAVKAQLKTDARAGRPWNPRTPEPAEPGMAKPRVSAQVLRASQIDGRPLPEFVTALIDMGLECWRDDRAAHGEPLC